MKPRVYIETSVVSYLTSRSNRDLIVAAHQQITIELWERRDAFEFYASELVLAEAGRGDTHAAAQRLKALNGIPLLKVSSQARDLGISKRGQRQLFFTKANSSDKLINWRGFQH